MAGKNISIKDWHDPDEIFRVINSLIAHRKNLLRISGDPCVDLKEFSIDWNSYEDVRKLGNRVRGRLNEISPKKRLSRKEWCIDVLDGINHIMDSDISFLFEDDYDEERRYYVYAHCSYAHPILNVKTSKNPFHIFAAQQGMTHLPFYIGKGTGDRAYNKKRNGYHNVVKNRLIEDNFGVTIIKDKICERDAFILEAKLIDIFGTLANKGSLTNISEEANASKRRFVYRDAFDRLRDINRIVE